MRGFSTWVCISLAIALTGCKEQPPANQGINVTAPGVNVKVDGSGVDVNAPGVKVNVPGK